TVFFQWLAVRQGCVKINTVAVSAVRHVVRDTHDQERGFRILFPCEQPTRPNIPDTVIPASFSFWQAMPSSMKKLILNDFFTAQI
ncbi:MAG: hypothetical protein OXC72_05540, partial [Roseovarius sp.]|nr:hypothetical protein [Roseovarius sp.]